jgi:hypothetical protein
MFISLSHLLRYRREQSRLAHRLPGAFLRRACQLAEFVGSTLEFREALLNPREPLVLFIARIRHTAA